MVTTKHTKAVSLKLHLFAGVVNALGMFIRPILAEAFLLGLFVYIHVHLVGIVFSARCIAAAETGYATQLRQAAILLKLSQQYVAFASRNAAFTLLIVIAILGVPHIRSTTCWQVYIATLVTLVISQWHIQPAKVAQHFGFSYTHALRKVADLGIAVFFKHLFQAIVNTKVATVNPLINQRCVGVGNLWSLRQCVGRFA